MAATELILTGASIVLPYILKLLGSKTLPSMAAKAAIPAATALATVPKGYALVKTAEGVTKLVTRGAATAAIKQGASLLAGPGVVPAALRQATPTVLSSILSGAGKTASVLGSAGQFALPIAVGAGGKLLQGASTGAGALTNALGNVPKAFVTSSQSKKELYGGSPLDSVADAIGGIGNAAGTTISAVGNAAGSSLTDIANSMKLMDLKDKLHARNIEQMQQVGNLNLSPSAANLYGQMLRSQSADAALQSKLLH